MTVLQNVIEGPHYVLKRSKQECIEQAEQLLDRVGMLNHRDFTRPSSREVSNSAWR